MGGVSAIQFYLDFFYFFNFAKPLRGHWIMNFAKKNEKTQTAKEGDLHLHMVHRQR